ncbi:MULTISPECIES: hypothetical protein [unclassified Streptomyces]|uniref:hypothetical protein n=1 Tax=unclassified Streptomyces TaxID=2593676 RepID=UPI0033174BCB
MTPSTVDPAPQLATGPAAPLHQLLESAVTDADFTAKVAVGDDGSSLAVTVYSSRAPWVTTTPEAASAWLAEAGVDASATLNEGFYVVIVLSTAVAVRQFIAAVLTSWITVHTIAARLIDLVEARGVLIEAAIDTGRIRAELPDSCLGSSVRFAELLGAPGVGDGLALQEPDGRRHLAERLQWLVTGVVGSAARTTAEPGCAHEQERLTLDLTLDQATLLVQRLERQGAKEAGA